MTAALPPISAITSAPLPFYDPAKGSFKLPPLVDDARRGSILLDTSDAMTYRHGHSRSSSVTSDATVRCPPSSSSSASTSSRSPSPAVQTPIPPRIPHDTRPSSTPSRRNSIVSQPRSALPAFKLIPQPMLDPSKRPIRTTDALVVFPSAAGVSQASQRKAKLLVGKDIETYFELQTRNGPGDNGASVPRAYAYKMVWERRGSQSQTFANVLSKAEGGRRGSRADMMDLTEDD
ncbi:hypothetical protein FRC01_009660 [Tulasnella sp. 417]|nr:hypothetical protein FRC01_009660 [Tulasnella sp. 417]